MNERYGPYPYGPFYASPAVYDWNDDHSDWLSWLWLTTNSERHEWHWHLVKSRHAAFDLSVYVRPHIWFTIKNAPHWLSCVGQA